MENEIYSKGIRPANGRPSDDTLTLTSEPNGFHLWAVVDGEPIHLAVFDAQTLAIDSAVEFAERIRQACRHNDNVAFMEYLTGFRDGLLRLESMVLVDQAERDRHCNARKS